MFDLAMGRTVPTGRVVENRKLVLCDVCCGVDVKIVGYGRKHYDGAQEKKSKKGERSIEGATFVHGGGK